MKKKIFISVFFVFCVFFILNIKNVNAATLEKSKVDLYALNSSYKDNYSLTIPSNYLQSYKINVKNATSTPKYSVIEGDSIVEVTQDGVVKPKAQKWTIVSQSTTRTEIMYEEGTAKVRVSVGGQNLDLIVSVHDYSTIYCDNILNKFIKENIKSEMTEYQKLDAITKYTAHNFDYSVYASGYKGMLLSGGGDCWASTSLIIKLCGKVGLKAHARNGNLDAGAGGGHENAVVMAGGKLYIAEAGFDEKKPRYYSISPEESGYTIDVLDSKNKTAAILQYDGFDTNISVPSEIDGFKITEIGEKAFARSYADFTSIKLPDTITTMKFGAFANCSKLKTVNIPKNVKNIEGPLFFGSENIKNINIQGNYTISDNILYTKDKSKLIEVLPQNKKTTIIIPNTVKEIGYCAFRFSKITGIEIPKTCEKIDDGAFENCSGLASVIIDNGVKSIGKNAFENISNLSAVQIPTSVTTIGSGAFAYSKNVTIYGTKGSTAESYAKQNSITFVSGTINKIDKNMITYNYSNPYNESKINLNLVVKIGNQTLKEGTDYTITYEKNGKNLGQHNATVKGKGKYSGNVSIGYYIETADPEIDFTCKDVYAFGEEVNPKVTKNPHNLKGLMFFYGKAGQGWYTNNKPTEVGEYKVYVRTENTNYNKSKEKTIKIIKELPFTDVKYSDWYYNAVKGVYKKNIIAGYNATTFAPNGNITRGQIVTILWRMEGCPKVSGGKNFTDVKSSIFYANPIKWASSKGIVNGYNNKVFGPNDNITREQLVVMLRNYANYKGKNTKNLTSIGSFKDNEKVSKYAKESVQWAVKNGIINGKTDKSGKLIDPQGKASRAEGISMIYNYYTQIK